MSARTQRTTKSKPERPTAVTGRWSMAEAAGGRLEEILECAFSHGPQRVTLDRSRSVLVIAERATAQQQPGQTLREIMRQGGKLGLDLKRRSVRGRVRDVEL